MGHQRRFKRDPGDPEGPIGEAYTGPGPIGETDETGEDPVAWEGAVDRFLDTLFPGVGLTDGATDPGD